MSEELPKDNVAVRCPDCKAIVYIAVNDPRVIDEDAKQEIGDLVVGGYTVEHMTLEQFKPEPFGHAESCKRNTSKQKQLGGSR